MEKIKINFLLKGRNMTAREFIDFTKDLISKLKKWDKLYQMPSAVNFQTQTNYYFKEDLSDFTFENLYSIINEEEISYKNENEKDKKLTINSQSWAGFSIVIFFGNQEETYDISLTISQGSEREKAYIEMEFSEENQSQLTKKYLTKLIELVAQNTNLIFANAITSKWFLKVRQRGQKSIGWINYSNNRKIADFLYNNEIIKQTENGILFCLTDEKLLDTDNQILIERAKKISNILQ